MRGDRAVTPIELQGFLAALDGVPVRNRRLAMVQALAAMEAAELSEPRGADWYQRFYRAVLERLGPQGGR